MSAVELRPIARQAMLASPRGGAKYALALRRISLVLSQLAVLAFKGLHLLSHLAGDTGPLAAIHLGFVDPVIQGLRRTADLRGNRKDCLPTRSMLALIVQHQSQARSRTSGEYVFVVLLMMLHPAQELEPPTNPGRFIAASQGSSVETATSGCASRWLERGK